MSTVEHVAPLSIGQCATLACVMEATAPKPGNVHRGADFEDLTYGDFLVAAIAIAPHMEKALATGLGPTVLAAVESTRAATGTNVNLGTILLLAPMAMVPRGRPLETGVPEVLARLDRHDARAVYEAIRWAHPGGIGQSDEADIYDEPPRDLIAAMKVAADWDSIARQYSNGFKELFHEVVPTLGDHLQAGLSPAAAIVQTHLEIMGRYPDSLIARKCGEEVAQRSAELARATLDAGFPGDESYERALTDLDFWLRSDGHRRNPGTTADLVAGGLFVALRDGIIKAPFRLGIEG